MKKIPSVCVIWLTMTSLSFSVPYPQLQKEKNDYSNRNASLMAINIKEADGNESKLSLFDPTSEHQQQQIRITGKIVEENGDPMPGVNVVVQGTSVGTVTDIDGNFSISVPNEESVLVFSFIGYTEQHIIVGVQKTINITLKEDTQQLEDVVVVGYGVQKKETVVGAVSQITTETLVRSGVTNVTNAIAGKLSGVLTIQQTGEPGSNDSEIIIRGLSSWNGSQPLMLVDGVERDFRDLDPNEISTFSVLKDASATAIFGAKGANGVIIVTTKRGLEGKPKLSVSASTGVEQIAKKMPHINAYTTMSMLNVAFMNQGMFTELIPKSILEEYRNPSTPLNALRYPDVNWFDLTTKKFAPTANVNINVSGGNDFIKYFSSLGYVYESDFFKNSNQGILDSRYWYHRINYRTNLDFNLTRTTKFSFNIGGDIGIKNQPAESNWRNLYSAPTTMFPAYFPAWVLEQVPDPDYPDDSGDRLSQAFGGYVGNPYNIFANGSLRRYLSSKIFTDIVLNQNLDFIIEGLSVIGKASLSTYYRNNSLTATYTYPQYMLDYNLIGIAGENPWYRAGEGNEVYVMPPVTIGIGGLQTDFYRDMYYEIGMNFSRNFGSHNTSALILGNRQEKNKGLDFPYYNQGLVGRATYNYKLKYLFEMNLAYTGSERFAPGNRYGFFPSGAIGYVISEEDFFKNAVPWISKLKVRYSDGFVGSDIAANRWLYISEFYEKSGYFNEDKRANDVAQWEEARKKDIGVEIGFFNNLFTATVDFFDEKRDKMLLEPRTVPFLVGTSFKELNMGKMKKHGFDVEVEFNKVTPRGLNYYIRGIFGYNENRIEFMDDLPYAPEYLKNAGKPIDVNMDGTQLTGTGYFTSVDNIHNNPSAIPLTSLNIGDYKYLDYNADGTINQNDKHPIKGSKYAPITYSFTPGFAYKGFNFHVMFQGNEGKYVSYDMTFEHEFTKGDYRIHKSQVDYWRPDNPYANHATLHYNVLSIDNIGWAGGSGDQGYLLGIPGRTWRDASYIRLKEIFASYTFDSRLFNKIMGISKMQVYATANNVFTWTTLIEGDPERKDFSMGFYPQMRRFTIGLNFSF